ncbi:MAG: FAD-dependent oxidoreductase [Myxococcota bacterium]|jgi:protoporphyrinogen oxidase|nr:FAD-dependent oxidoreductase [Myxococcota bacterium]
MESPTLIAGAGLAGLACAHQLKSDYLLIEKADTVGGVARSFERNGFLFDCTGHWLHLRDPYIKEWVKELLPEGMLEISRRSEIYSHQVRTLYPFQANTYGLPEAVVKECVDGYFAAREKYGDGKNTEAKTFEDFILQRMGEGIAKHFMVPYNSKLWTVHPKEMLAKWCDRFVPTPEPDDVLRGSKPPDGNIKALGYNTTLLYPKAGGIGTLSQRMATSLNEKPRLQTTLTKIDWQTTKASLNNQDEVGYQSLVSTLPLPVLVGLLNDPPEDVQQAAARLRCASVTYWDVGVAGENNPEDAHWTYFPEAHLPFYRVGSASAAFAYSAPEAHRSYYVETSHPRGTPCPHDEEAILNGLRQVGYLSANEEPLFMQRSTIDYAYVIMDKHYGQARATIHDWLGTQNIYSVGRYGDWRYDSMEGAMLQGIDCARKILETP